ncbi:invasion associated locus B family protein [Nitratireductor sp. CAU 1489]|uniref:Invasion associated locus B family protein n=1 Tax=Nitratireductor arenosus TaxID=2682096 RepID=A0A844QIF9_9HYPH|nr:invasion associated locus B family protein [Nitratireductor arenosus]MVA97813.1 invasion associated locus B family protein [Nitratireductor arenosus]
MKMNRTSAKRTAVLAVAAAGFLAANAIPVLAQQAQQPQIPRGWFKACSKQEDVDICNVQNIVLADSGQLITGVSLIEIKGKVNRNVFQVTVPTGRLMAPGVGLQVDGGKAQKVNYAVCLPDRCVAEVPLTDSIIASFKKGGELTLTSVNFQNKPNPIKVSLQGFTDAFDGPPLQQSDIEERQKKLQDFVSKNNEDFAKKLKEEQEKAKASE